MNDDNVITENTVPQKKGGKKKPKNKSKKKKHSVVKSVKLITTKEKK